jgi:hypothetical protein
MSGPTLTITRTTRPVELTRDSSVTEVTLTRSAIGLQGLPGDDQLTADELAAIQGAATPSAANVFATMAHNQAETTITFTDVATGNASTTAHGFVPKATAPDAAQLNVLGIAVGETVYTNKALFDALTPADLGVSAAGSSIIAAHRDHVHKIPSAADVIVVFTPTNYTPASTTVEAHLAAIDAALGLLA